MKKTIAQLIDELSITNIKIFMLVDKVKANIHTREEAKKIDDLNTYRSKLMNAITEELGGEKVIKVGWVDEEGKEWKI